MFIFGKDRSKYRFCVPQIACTEVEGRQAHLSLQVGRIGRSRGLQKDKRLWIVLRQNANGRHPLQRKRNDAAILRLGSLQVTGQLKGFCRPVMFLNRIFLYMGLRRSCRLLLDLLVRCSWFCRGFLLCRSCQRKKEKEKN